MKPENLIDYEPGLFTKYWVYIMTNKNQNVLYTGVTSNIGRRMHEHKSRIYKNSFTARYNCYFLIYFEEFDSLEEAMHREYQLKKYRREYKENLINGLNPEWKDLSELWDYDS